jgi:hypothetical protein
MSARPSAFGVHAEDQILAALAEAGAPMSTPDLQVATGYSPRFGQLVYNTLARLAAAGQVEKITTRGVKPVFWRRLAPVIALPPLTITTDHERPS